MEDKKYRLPKRIDGKKTFDRIVETGTRLFAQYGFHATSINKIIFESKLATGTFYLYFDDKQSLYVYLIDIYGAKIRSAIHDGIKGAKTRYEMEREGLKAFITFAWHHPISYRIFWEAMYVDFEIFKNYYQDFAKAYIKGLKMAQETGEVVKDIDLETLAFVLMGVSNFVGLMVLFEENVTIDYIEDLTDKTMSILSQGMFTK